MRNHLYRGSVRRQLKLSCDRLLTRRQGMSTYGLAAQFSDGEHELVDGLYASVLSQLALEPFNEEAGVALLAKVARELSQLDRASTLRCREPLPATANGHFFQRHL
jgi:hypothetical protein